MPPVGNNPIWSVINTNGSGSSITETNGRSVTFDAENGRSDRPPDLTMNQKQNSDQCERMTRATNHPPRTAIGNELLEKRFQQSSQFPQFHTVVQSFHGRHMDCQCSVILFALEQRDPLGVIDLALSHTDLELIRLGVT